MRILITAESYLPYLSGVTISTEALARGLGARGHDVMLMAPRPARGADPGSGGAAGPAPRYAWLPSYQLPRVVPAGYRMPWPGAWSDAAWEAAAFAPHVVHAQSPFVTGLMARRIARRARAPLVFTHHTRFAAYGHYLGPFGGPGSAVTDAYLHAFWRGCAAVIAPSTDLAVEIQARLGERRRPFVRAIPTGIAVDGIATLPPFDVRREAGWPDDAIVATSLGRLAAEKRVDLLLEALAAATRGDDGRLRLALLGGGPAETSLRRRAQEPDLLTRVWFAGHRPRDEALSLLRGADLFLFASRTETQGLVLAEALAAGLPAVSLAGPGVADSIRDGVDGVIVPRRPGSEASDLGTALAELARNAAARGAMSAAATAGAHRFDARHRIAQVEELYEELVS